MVLYNVIHSVLNTSLLFIIGRLELFYHVICIYQYDPEIILINWALFCFNGQSGPFSININNLTNKDNYPILKVEKNPH